MVFFQDMFCLSWPVWLEQVFCCYSGQSFTVDACFIVFFREFRCMRHKIHIGLFFAFSLSAFNWICTSALVSFISEASSNVPYMLDFFSIQNTASVSHSSTLIFPASVGSSPTSSISPASTGCSWKVTTPARVSIITTSTRILPVPTSTVSLLSVSNQV